MRQRPFSVNDIVLYHSHTIPTPTPIAGSVQLFGSGSQTEAAAPATLTLADGRTGSEFTYSIPPRSETRLETANPAGLTQQTGSIGVVADSHDEGSETLTLSNASGARSANATATIENSDPMPRALMARSGRTATVHVVEQVEELRPAGCRRARLPAVRARPHRRAGPCGSRPRAR